MVYSCTSTELAAIRSGKKKSFRLPVTGDNPNGDERPIDAAAPVAEGESVIVMSSETSSDNSESVEITVTEVMLERLRDITVEGILDEGHDIELPPVCQLSIDRQRLGYPKGYPEGYAEWPDDRKDSWAISEGRATYMGWLEYADNLIASYSKLWNARNDKDNIRWKDNPWVWVITFTHAEQAHNTTGGIVL